MGKYEALETIKSIWNATDISLGDKIRSISSEYYSNGLDLAGTAAFLNATPSELDAFLALGELDDEDIDKISEVNPPKTTWIMLANASEEELDGALAALKKNRDAEPSERVTAMTEYVYTVMLDVAGPTTEQKVGNLSGDILLHVLKKGQDFKLLSEKEEKFIKSVAGYKKRGKVLSERQTKWLMDILNRMADAGAIVRNSIDGDKDICNQILDALDR